MNSSQPQQQSFQRRALPHATSDAASYVTASMGIARAAPGLTAEAIIALADKALYRAKERGRNCWVS
ncbi:MAG: diguanylate cyclase [Pantoea sp.]|uniref:diguanylate cyclase domain-containing protein n=1 Tax=Pantoea sp. TaxID=69393 RepID=UPI00238ED7E3|nr:diguanylate cyclase [Pantoea sp.]MDE1186781.1 diguanylate cyclase [Pantoea sp.]